jgi:hypothetical protein
LHLERLHWSASQQTSSQVLRRGVKDRSLRQPSWQALLHSTMLVSSAVASSGNSAGSASTCSSLR